MSRWDEPLLYTMGHQNLQFLEVFMLNNMVFRWPKPLFFMVLEAHGSYKWRYKL